MQDISPSPDSTPPARSIVFNAWSDYHLQRGSLVVLTPTLAENKIKTDVAGYYGYATGSKGDLFYMRFIDDPKAQLTFVDENFMSSRKWLCGEGDDSAWITGCKKRGLPIWQSKSAKWKPIIEGVVSSGKGVGCDALCVQELPGYPSWKSGGSSHHVPYQTSEPTGCLRISVLNASIGLVPLSNCACADRCAKPDQPLEPCSHPGCQKVIHHFCVNNHSENGKGIILCPEHAPSNGSSTTALTTAAAEILDTTDPRELARHLQRCRCVQRTCRELGCVARGGL